ncbi:cytochrome c [Paenibacillus sp. NEAU-GSW1]|uniref:c-type cytochrome n=1 Tax=Paenibacillus sp. NEAU-GSW1 TaxID=2682486 RepID=UPI0012E2E576|nr:cytochrome c [Paenibacillus sp. NEAU-GSW1]MUT67769.1 c-type cytochrome [Paenibacillus sp. NEAU-GSW1]
MTISRSLTSFAAFVALVALAVMLTGCGATSDNGGASKENHMDAPESTAAVYKSNCVSCHGSELQGRIGPGTNLQQVGSRMSEQDIVAQIEQGDGGTMPGFKDQLTDEQIAGLAAWLAGKK